MPADVDHVGLPIADGDGVSLADSTIDGLYPVGITLRGCYPAAGHRLDHRIAAGVVGMPVSVPDLRDLPAPRSGLTQVFVSVGCVDAHRLAALAVVEQVAVVVGKAGELVNFEHGTSLLAKRDVGAQACSGKGRLSCQLTPWASLSQVNSALNS